MEPDMMRNALYAILALQIICIILAIYSIRKSIWALKSSISVKRRIESESVNSTKQLEHLASVYRKTGLTWGDLPPTRGWAASPDFLDLIYDLIVDLRPKTVVELGSGTSSIVGASALKHNQAGALYTIDHDDKFLRQTKNNLNRVELDQWVTTIHAPLSAYATEDSGVFWYDLSASNLPDKIDLLIVDGPPEPIVGPGGRAPAIDVFFRRLTPNGCAIFDDANRTGEKITFSEVLEKHPNFTKEFRKTEKGAAIFFRGCC